MLLALPLFSIRLGFGDTGNLKEDKTAAQAYDLHGRRLRRRLNGPLFLASTDPTITPDKAEAGRRGPRAADNDITFATPGVQVGRGTWFWQVYPVSSPQDQATTDLVTPAPRHDAAGHRRRREGRRFSSAASIDFADYLAGRLPLLIGAVLILSFLLLMIVFRSLLVPLKAVIMNLLSVGAAYGVIVAIFQWGWAQEPVRRRQGRPDRGLGPDDAVRHRVRPVDGLRGVPARRA